MNDADEIETRWALARGIADAIESWARADLAEREVAARYAAELVEQLERLATAVRHSRRGLPRENAG